MVARTATRYLRRELICNGNRESLRMSLMSRDSIIWWALKTHGTNRARYEPVFADPAPFHHLRLHRVRGPREAEALLRRLSEA